MKIIQTLLILTVLSGWTHCGQDYEVDQFKYEAYTRGSLYRILVNKDSVMVRSGLKGLDVRNRPITKKEWQLLQDIVNQVSLDNIAEYTSEGEKRFADAAPFAFLEIQRGEKAYTSSEFDHGNPPEPLSPLVKAMITLAETVE